MQNATIVKTGMLKNHNLTTYELCIELHMEEK